MAITSPKPPRHWYRLHISTWLAGLAVAGVMFFFNAGGTVITSWERHGEVCTHGWPWPYLARESRYEMEGWSLLDRMLYGEQSPPIGFWPWNGGSNDWNPAALCGDIAIAIGLVFLALVLFEFRRRRAKRFSQFTLRELVVVLILSAVGAWWASRYFEEDRLTWRQRELLLTIARFEPFVTEGGVPIETTPAVDIEAGWDFSTDVMRHHVLSLLGCDEWHGNVTALDVEAAAAAKIVDGIARFPELRDLKLLTPGTKRIDGINKLNGLTKLKRLVLYVWPTERDIGLFADLPELSNIGRITLHISSGERPLSFNELEQISQTRNITQLWIEDHIRTPDGFPLLSRLDRLEALSIKGAGVDDAALEIVASLPRLRLLELDDAPNMTNKGLVTLLRSRTLKALYLRDALGGIESEAFKSFKSQASGIRVDTNEMPTEEYWQEEQY